MDCADGLGLHSDGRGYDPETQGPLDKSSCFADAMAIVERYRPEILQGSKRLLTAYKLRTGDVARLFSHARVVEEIGAWLGELDGDGKFPNVGRWVEIDELYDGVKDLLADHRTWKRRSAFRDAVGEHLPALRVLGVQKKREGGVTLLKFMPDPKQLDLCGTNGDLAMFRDCFAS